MVHVVDPPPCAGDHDWHPAPCLPRLTAPGNQRDACIRLDYRNPAARVLSTWPPWLSRTTQLPGLNPLSWPTVTVCRPAAAITFSPTWRPGMPSSSSRAGAAVRNKISTVKSSPVEGLGRIASSANRRCSGGTSAQVSPVKISLVDLPPVVVPLAESVSRPPEPPQAPGVGSPGRFAVGADCTPPARPQSAPVSPHSRLISNSLLRAAEGGSRGFQRVTKPRPHQLG